ncbi:hypothetical protein SRABI106_02895 [Rahnella aquatilis]|nr:hypothetical protein SRABI106_02895 [Rahnella aquatilis]
MLFGRHFCARFASKVSYSAANCGSDRWSGATAGHSDSVHRAPLQLHQTVPAKSVRGQYFATGLAGNGYLPCPVYAPVAATGVQRFYRQSSASKSPAAYRYWSASQCDTDRFSATLHSAVNSDGRCRADRVPANISPALPGIATAVVAGNCSAH